jgi:hypothetical protein
VAIKAAHDGEAARALQHSTDDRHHAERLLAVHATSQTTPCITRAPPRRPQKIHQRHTFFRESTAAGPLSLAYPLSPVMQKVP